MSFSDLDLDIKCLLAKPIELNKIGTLHHLTIDEISEIGFDTYNHHLGLLCISQNEISTMLELNEEKNVEPFDFIIQNCIYGNDEFKNEIIKALELFFKDTVMIHAELECFFIGLEGVLHKGNYNFVIDILKRMNNVETDKVEVKNQAERDVDKQLKELRAKYSKFRDSNIDIATLISSISAKHPSLNLFNIGNLTLYQLMNQYQVLNAIDNYFIGIDSLMHGADKKGVELNHWSAKQKK